MNDQLTAAEQDWLPTGHHWGLTITRHPVGPTGPMMPNAGPKLMWHTTEGSYSSAFSKFRTGLDAPTILIDPAGGFVTQFLPFSQFAKALEHPAGTPETNRANCVQVEVAGYARQAEDWSQSWYDNLGALAVLIEHRVPIPRVSRHAFTATPVHQARRLTPQGFIRAAGHLGHEHAPSQPGGHWDPGRFEPVKLFSGMKHAEGVFA